MKMFRHLSSVFAIATIAPLALAATLAVTPAIAQADQLPNPDWVALLSDYEKNYGLSLFGVGEWVGGGGAGRVVWGYGYHVVVHRRPATA